MSAATSTSLGSSTSAMSTYRRPLSLVLMPVMLPLSSASTALMAETMPGRSGPCTVST